MPEAVYRMLTLLGTLVVRVPVGTNLGLLHLPWMLVSGQLLATRGAVIPGLSACGLSERAVRRAWAALGQGDWTIEQLLARWRRLVMAEGRWQPHCHGGYRPVGVDVTGCWRPRLPGCPTSHDHAQAGKALPAILVGLIGRVGSVGGQRLALPLAVVRADPADPRSRTQERRLVRAAVAQCAPDEALVLDTGFDLALLQAEGATRYVVRQAKNATFRRATPPAYSGRGRPPTRGVLVRPLPLAAKQMVGAARAFVHAPETCQRLPALALLAGAILSYSAACSPPIPTGFWDRHPQPTPGRLRRALARCPFPHDFPLPARIRAKAAPTAQLPTGFWGQRRRRTPAAAGTAAPPARPEAA